MCSHGRHLSRKQNSSGKTQRQSRTPSPGSVFGSSWKYSTGLRWRIGRMRESLLTGRAAGIPTIDKKLRPWRMTCWSFCAMQNHLEAEPSRWSHAKCPEVGLRRTTTRRSAQYGSKPLFREFLCKNCIGFQRHTLKYASLSIPIRALVQ